MIMMMRVFQLTLLSTLLLLIKLRLIVGDVGTAASYGPPYIPTACDGNIRQQFPPGNLFVAVNEGLWDNGAACGRRYRIRCVSVSVSGSNNINNNNRPCKGGTIDVKVVDLCDQTPCPHTLLLSTDAFSAISRFSNAKINIEYTQI